MPGTPPQEMLEPPRRTPLDAEGQTMKTRTTSTTQILGTFLLFLTIDYVTKFLNVNQFFQLRTLTKTV